MFLLISFLIILMLVVIIAFIDWLIEFTASYSEYINFNKFLKYYNMDPDKWRWYEYGVGLKNGPDFKFGFIGFWRYKLYRFNTKQQDTDQLLKEMFEEK
jgi:hypothetical protein